MLRISIMMLAFCRFLYMFVFFDLNVKLDDGAASHLPETPQGRLNPWWKVVYQTTKREQSDLSALLFASKFKRGWWCGMRRDGWLKIDEEMKKSSALVGKESASPLRPCNRMSWCLLVLCGGVSGVGVLVLLVVVASMAYELWACLNHESLMFVLDSTASYLGEYPMAMS
ncbi:hypothetical protein M8C21_007846 [Ambrosia artemisiifolia]|uniref:Uncharacterized protein n=1 Tax=Ambrosia artemisiifolia TaxID=4212 RepID=A0AAD5CX42_AMBAR|nr:hypothetical protein M8C21_007846 [Ambrosia artemisiifolia]